MNDVTIVDYGMGNLFSVRLALEYCGAKVNITADPETVIGANKLILPGVGAYSRAMEELTRTGLDDAIKIVASNGTPILGICLGMQMLLDYSEEFQTTDGLGLIKGRVLPIPSISVDGSSRKIPHIGWASLQKGRSVEDWYNTFLSSVNPYNFVYFVHSFMARPDYDSNIMAVVDYAGISIAAVIAKNNVIGCQFHPEKSGPVGLNFLTQFLKM